VAESELSISYDDLLVEVAAFLGYGSTASAWSVDQRAEADRYVQAGVRRFYYPPAAEGAEAGYQWSFLNPVTTLTTVADAGTQDLPENLGRVLGNFHFDQSEHRASAVQVTEQRLQELLSRSDDTAPPQVARVRHKVQTSGGQRLEVAWWPVPDGAYVLTYRYEAYAGKLSATVQYPLGGMRHSELLVQACLSVAEQRANDERGIHTAEFERMLIAAIRQDRSVGAQHYGHMGAPDEQAVIPRHGETGVSYDITYKGTTY